jgi:hypothetical protein
MKKFTGFMIALAILLISGIGFAADRVDAYHINLKGDIIIKNTALKQYPILMQNYAGTTVFRVDSSGVVVFSGTVDPTITNTVAGGDRGIALNITQSTAVDLTGTLVGVYARATGGDDGAAGTVRGCEIGARVTDATGNILTTATGGYFWADTKTRAVTTLRGVEVSLDGGAGGTATLAVGFEAFNNSSGTQTTSIAYDVNEGSASGRKAYTYDIRGQLGETISNATDGAWAIRGALNYAIAGGTNIISAGLLGGAGTSTSATQTLGATGGKAFSYYLSSTSTTASHELHGYYMNMNYGVTGGASASPSGDVIRGRAYLMGDASGANAITGGAFTVELEATTASNTGLTAGMRGNLVLPSGVMTNPGTFYGTMAEVFLSGNAVNTTAYTRCAPLGVVIGGTAPTAAAQLSNMSLIDFELPANEIGDGLLVDDASSTATVGAKLKIKINGTTYWIMLADAHD